MSDNQSNTKRGKKVIIDLTVPDNHDRHDDNDDSVQDVTQAMLQQRAQEQQAATIDLVDDDSSDDVIALERPRLKVRLVGLPLHDEELIYGPSSEDDEDSRKEDEDYQEPVEAHRGGRPPKKRART